MLARKRSSITERRGLPPATGRKGLVAIAVRLVIAVLLFCSRAAYAQGDPWANWAATETSVWTPPAPAGREVGPSMPSPEGGTLIATGVSQNPPASPSRFRSQPDVASYNHASYNAAPANNAPYAGGPYVGDSFGGDAYGSAATGGVPFNRAPFEGAPFEAAPHQSAPFDAAQFEAAYGGHAPLSPPAWSGNGAPSGRAQQAGWAAPTHSSNGCAIDSLADAWECQLLPAGLLYQSYLAGEKEPRISSANLYESDRGMVWDVTLGGRVGLWRYGTRDPLHPQGIQFDIEGAAMVRLDPEHNTDVEATDFRFGFLVTWRRGPLATKTGYYHISSHLGDEFLLSNPGFKRLNYVRDSAIAGISYDVTPEVRVYSEIGYAIGHEGGALPLEFQYGAEYSPTTTSWWGGPFAAVNGHTREERNWASSINFVGGWQWRGDQTQHRFRVGMQYYQGPALQYSFVGRDETLLGGGLWFDY